MNKLILRINELSPEIKTCFSITLLSVCLILFRVLWKQEIYYTFLIWNIFLAWIPLLFLQHDLSQTNKVAMYYFLILWLLFLPNSPYIITDLLHLKNYGNSIIWYDTLLIFTFALTGLILGLVSMKQAHLLLKRIFNAKTSWITVLILNLLSGFGIYLGRYCRINTWDLFTKPLITLKKIAVQLENPLSLKISFVYGLTMFAFYFIYQQNTNKKEIKLPS